MTSVSDEELPVEPASTPYPTAIHPAARPTASHDPPATAEDAPSTDQPQPVVAEKPPAAAKQRLDAIPIRTPPIAPMAVIPSPLRMNRAPEPIAVEMPAAAPAPAPLADTTLVEIVPVLAPDTLPPIVSPSDVQAVPAAHGSAGASPSQSLPVIQSPSEQLPEERLQAIASQRDVLIAMLEDEVRQRTSAVTPDPLLGRIEQELRLLYAGAERVDDAARPVDSLSDAERAAYKNLMFGLSTWLTTEEARRAPLRNARVMRSLREATGELAAASKLDLRNLAFCERVQSYGWFTEFARNEFQPKQQVILYVEVDNFAALEKSPTSFETELQGHYQIFDSRGNIVAERKLPLDQELCRNYRRDYFLAYPIYMPESIAAGRYRLELTIEDLKATGEYQGRKFGEGMIEFAIRG